MILKMDFEIREQEHQGLGQPRSWKRAIMMAVEGGYDRVALITGQQAADLYDLAVQDQQGRVLGRQQRRRR